MIPNTKARTLAWLDGKISEAKVLPLFCFTVKEWNDNQETIFATLEQQDWLASGFEATPLIVRSSGLDEDTQGNSLAGHYKSVLDVTGSSAVVDAIREVIDAFGENGTTDNEVFIQPMLTNVALSGVAFSRDPSTAGHYFVINYDDQSGSTESVTSGYSNDNKVYYQAKCSELSPQSKLQPVIALLQELELLTDNDALDIEFAITDRGDLYLFQLRPLLLRVSNVLSMEQHAHQLELIASKARSTMSPHPYLHGEKTIYGVMPDWNPAEIIGVRPKPLALSLYKELVTDNIWAYQRDNYGYQNLRSFPLLIHFSGLPYIDVRVSFNSFIPADIEPDLANRLVNHYMDQLAQNPSSHDKVEFDIVDSCYSLDLEQRLQRLMKHGFSHDDIASLSKSLRKLTNNVINENSGLWKEDIKKIDELELRRNKILDSNLDLVSKIYWLLEDCKRYGTLPFAGLARAGFIAIQMLRSMEKMGVFSKTDYSRYMASLNTITAQLSDDLRDLSKKAFIRKYRHLRPGTYEISSNRYDDTPDEYFDWEKLNEVSSAEKTEETFALSLQQLNRLETLLRHHRLEHDVLGLFRFIKGAIEGREYAKFVFTKSLSDAMRLFEQLGNEVGISREDMSFADIDVVKKAYSSSSDVKTALKNSIKQGKALNGISNGITLPPIITKIEDLYSFELLPDEPNYVTLKSVTGKVVMPTQKHSDLSGNIVMIPSADPGYDWIFSHDIGGFITKYGGVNSHMAIRANEAGIPAIIGAGEALYEKWFAAKILNVDCANRQTQIIQ